MSRSKRAFISFLNLYRFLLRKEMESKVKVSLWTRLRMLSRGFLSISYVLYDGFRKHDRHLYFSDWAHTRVAMVNGRWEATGFPAVLDNKIYFASVLSSHIPVSPVYAYIEHGRVFPLDERWSDDTTVRSAIGTLGNPIVIKPVAGIQGQGILFVEVKGGDLCINGQPVGDDEIDRRIKSMHECIISGFIAQGPFPAGLYPHSTNTMRILTMWDVHTQRPFIAAAVHRIGTAKSAPLDNWSRGGLGAAIDLETGELGAATCDPGERTRLTWYETHPDTGAPIAGQRVPEWRGVCEQILKTAAAVPFLKFIGWDIIQTSDGICAIEGNPDCGVRFLQVHRPLLLDPRVRAFFEHYGFLKPTTLQQQAPAPSARAT